MTCELHIYTSHLTFSLLGLCLSIFSDALSSYFRSIMCIEIYSYKSVVNQHVLLFPISNTMLYLSNLENSNGLRPILSYRTHYHEL